MHGLASAPDEPGATGVWMRSAMGLKSSPHNSVQGLFNPYTWDPVCLNLRGMESYDPTQPWISRLQSDGLHATEITQYTDDIQITAPTEDLAWECISKMAKGLGWLGLQDAAHQRISPSQELGAWAGASTVSTNSGRICKGATKERWIKLQDQICWIALLDNLRCQFLKLPLEE
eukprot:jgi/Psemu1/9278/gm1.9278_g